MGADGKGVRMKMLLLAALLAARVFPAHGQEADNSTPAELLDARARYEAAVADAVKPIRERYIEELEQLRATAFATKNADLAFAVGNEIASLGGKENGLADLDGVGYADASLKEDLINTTWVWYASQTITLLPDGMARWSGNHNEAFTWKIVGTNPATIEGKAWNGNKYRMTLDPGMRTGKVTEGTLAARPTSQIYFK